MTRTLTYVDDVQVSKSVAENVRTILFNWHNPSNGNYGRHFREEPVIVDGEQETNTEGNPLWNVHLAASIDGVPEQDIGIEKTNLVQAINTAFPAEWPSVEESEIAIQ